MREENKEDEMTKRRLRYVEMTLRGIYAIAEADEEQLLEVVGLFLEEDDIWDEILKKLKKERLDTASLMYGMFLMAQDILAKALLDKGEEELAAKIKRPSYIG